MSLLSYGRDEWEDADEVGASEDEDEGEKGDEGGEHGCVLRQPPLTLNSTANPACVPYDIDHLNRTPHDHIELESRRESTYATGGT